MLLNTSDKFYIGHVVFKCIVYADDFHTPNAIIILVELVFHVMENKSDTCY